MLCVPTNCAEFSRPRSLLVFVNPVAGRGRSTRIYREKVASLFELARVATEVIVTEKRHHAQNVLQEIDLEQFDGLVSIAFVYSAAEERYVLFVILPFVQSVLSQTCCVTLRNMLNRSKTFWICF